jgi:hypothetical protein
MSIQRTQSSHSDNAAREVDKPQDRPADKAREPNAELVDRFRTLMQSRADGKEQRLDPRLQGQNAGEATGADAQGEAGQTQAATEQAVQRKGDSEERGGQHHAGGETLQPAELAALMQAQVLSREVPAMPAPTQPTPAANSQALADMLERHVRQLAVGGGDERDSGQVLLRLSDATLPGTDLLLSRTETGWRLRADVRSRGSYEAIQQAAPQLAERFASRNLGSLEIDSQFHG